MSHVTHLAYLLGMGYLYLIVILFMALLSGHILMWLSFLGTNKAGTIEGLKHSYTSPLDISSSTWL